MRIIRKVDFIAVGAVIGAFTLPFLGKLCQFKMMSIVEYAWKRETGHFLLLFIGT